MDIRAVKFRVGSEWRVGGLYSPSWRGPHGAVLCLHGFPGVQKNEDIASELCRRGMVAFIPHFRGSWGSSGRYSIPGLLQDARTAHRLLSRYRHVDGERVAIFGVSMGAWVALRLAAEVFPAAAAVMAPAAAAEESAQAAEYARKNGKVLRLDDPSAIVRDAARAMREPPPEDYLGRYSSCPLLFVQGLRDSLILPSSTRRLYALAREPKRLVELDGEGHEFQNDRALVVRKVCDWLERHLAEPAPAANKRALLTSRS